MSVAFLTAPCYFMGILRQHGLQSWHALFSIFNPFHLSYPCSKALLTHVCFLEKIYVIISFSNFNPFRPPVFLNSNPRMVLGKIYIITFWTPYINETFFRVRLKWRDVMCLYVTPGKIQFASVVKYNSDKIILPTSPLDSLRNPKVTKTRAIPQHTNLDRVKLKGLEISIFCIAGMQRQK